MPEPIRTRPVPRPLTAEDRAEIAKLPNGELTPLQDFPKDLRQKVLGAAAHRVASQPRDKGRPFSP